ncbi:hypothetical protein I4U23_022750 [Adineta vaga]|nr:hypothetical protein I4U23_022750 [Adineta vaga]
MVVSAFGTNSMIYMSSTIPLMASLHAAWNITVTDCENDHTTRIDRVLTFRNQYGFKWMAIKASQSKKIAQIYWCYENTQLPANDIFAFQ